VSFPFSAVPANPKATAVSLTAIPARIKAISAMFPAVAVKSQATAVMIKAVPARSKAIPVILTATALRSCGISANINKTWYKISLVFDKRIIE
jgi:hypothetical protein